MNFAAGFGTRMGTLTKEVPKPMLPLNGTPIVDRAIQIGRDARVSKMVANVHYLAERIRPHLQSKGVTVLKEHPDILDTGGGLKAASDHLTSPTFTLNPDAVWNGPNPLDVLLQAWHPTDEALLLLVPVKSVVGRERHGDFDLAGRTIQRGGKYVYTGAQLIRTEVVKEEAKSVFSLNVSWDKMAERGKLCGIVYTGQWIDIGTEDNLKAAQNLECTRDI